MSTPRVRVYSTTYCPYCTAAKRLLDKRGIAYAEIDVTDDPDERARVTALTHHRTVPMIFVGERFVGGSDELHALDRSGELAKMLAAPDAPGGVRA